MPENYDHYITKNIKALYKRRLFSPIVYLIIVIVLWHVFSLTDLLFPVQLTDDVPLESAYRNVSMIGRAVSEPPPYSSDIRAALSRSLE